MNPPSVHRRALIIWLAIYPGITVLSVLLGPVLAPLPVYLRTLVLTGILVPAAVYGLVPALLRANAALTGRRRSGRSTAGADALKPAADTAAPSST
ncbi:hypothetical protein ACFV4P_35015 [Kitasatospora sp. NPDC059795]|uniref:hypothetical protein n=1 Tax=Kitasatospora sp. NPDC059795 TaxID=3346949 RepID=UPI0036539283